MNQNEIISAIEALVKSGKIPQGETLRFKNGHDQFVKVSNIHFDRFDDCVRLDYFNDTSRASFRNEPLTLFIMPFLERLLDCVKQKVFIDRNLF